jgi:outer membrane immunogenic protein
MRKAILGAMGLAVAGVIGFSGAASAADVYARGGSLKDEPVVAFLPTWAGLYIGGSVGYGWGDSAVDIGDTVIDTEPNGAIYGAHIGYNFQRGNVVFGVEAGLNGANLEDSLFGGVIESELDWYATGVARLGLAYDKALFYGFGGVAWGDVKTTFAPGPTFTDEETHVGWTAGVGVEYAITDRFSLRVEYSHVDLGSENTFSEDGCGSACETDLSFDTVKVGASYRFGGHDEALK